MWRRPWTSGPPPWRTSRTACGGSCWDPVPGLELEEVEKDVLYKIENIALKKAELGVDKYGNPIKNSDPEGPEIIGDSFKVGKSSKRGTTINEYYPDGVENNRTVAEDGIYTIWFRPNGDGTAEDGWVYVYKETDPEGNPASHGCTNGGYMFKMVKTADLPEPTEPATEAPKPTEPEKELIPGDVDGDGNVTIFDVTYIQKYLAGVPGYKELTNAQKKAADVDGDGEVTITDATYIQRYLAGIDDGDKVHFTPAD